MRILFTIEALDQQLMLITVITDKAITDRLILVLPEIILVCK